MALHLVSWLSLILAACGHASTIGRRIDNTTAPCKMVKFPVFHSTNRDVFTDVWSAIDLDRRGIETAPLANRSDVAYYARLEIGNPPQPNFVQLDTGSFELWVNPDCSNLSGASDVQFCRAVGSYDSSQSSTAAASAATKKLRYGIGSANIQYVTDDIIFSNQGTQLQDVQFGVATSTVDEFSGIMGIGYGENVTITYKNFIDELQDQAVTDTKAFSLALGSKDEQEGVVIFGGLDTAKFSGTLQSLPIIPAAQSPDGVARYWVDMDFMSLTTPSGKMTKYANTSMAVFLDSGATLTLLPTKLADAIAADFGSNGADSNGFYNVDCALNNLAGTVDFAFPGVTVRVPYNEMIRELRTGFGTECYLGITPNEDFTLLGDTFLRSAYAVFDQSTNAIYLAQYTNCGTNEIEITTSTNMSQITGKCEPSSFNSVSNTTASSPTSSRSSSTATRTVGGADSTYWVSIYVVIWTTASFVGII